ncbi:MAG: lysylphosphatidylglycerol synthase transmembrane domain-containing protein [Acidobacteria bacterium]|nr:lysylphosphatidylglycerol synthase transmembrane domain-containing protein [Acidobacteriota bacterium]
MRVVVGSIIGLVALWLAFRGESPGALVAAIGQTDPWWTMAALVSIAASLALVTERWRVLFGRSTHHSPRWGLLFKAQVVGQAVNIALPIRVGELVRVLLVSRTGGQTLERTFVTVVAERLMDMGVVALAAAWLALQVTFPPWLAGPVRAMTIAGLIAAALGVATMLAGRRVSAFLRAKVETLTHKGLARFARRSATAVGEAAQLRDPRTLGAALALSAVILLLSVFTNYLLLLAFHIPVSPVAALLVLLVLQVGSAPVSTPGNLGVFQYLTVLALGVYSVDRTTAVAYSVVLYVIAYGPKLVLGAWLLARVTRDATLGPDVLAMIRGRR